MDKPSIQVYLVDDPAILRAGFKSMLEGEPGLSKEETFTLCYLD